MFDRINTNEPWSGDANIIDLNEHERTKRGSADKRGSTTSTQFTNSIIIRTLYYNYSLHDKYIQLQFQKVLSNHEIFNQT